MSETDLEPASPTPPRWRVGLALVLAVCPWGAIWWGLYRGASAPLAFAAYHLLCLAGALLLRAPGLPPVAEGAALRLRRRQVVAVVAAANAATVAAYLTVGGLILDRPHVLALMESRGLTPASYVWLFPYFVLVNPLVEELFWRRSIYATLRRATPSWPAAAAVSALFFGAWHWTVVRLFVAPPLALLATAAIAAVGFALALVYERTRRLGYCIALHAFAADAPLLVVLLLLGRP